jgi:hypothetical protein
MGRAKSSDRGRNRRAPARTLEAREQQLSDAAYDLAEDQIREGTASSQVITHFLKMGSTRELVEQERLRGQIEVDRVKAEQLEGQKRMESLVSEAFEAFRTYSGQGPVPELGPGD